MKNKTIIPLLYNPHLSDNIVQSDIGYSAFIEFKPYNINILKENDKISYLTEFSHMISSLGPVSFICTDVNQNYKENILYIKSRIENEKSKQIKKMLEKDYEYISGYYGNLPIKRIFLIQLSDKKYDDLETKIYSTCKILSGYGIEYSILSKEEVKNVISKQFSFSTPKEGLEEYEGEKAINYWSRNN